MEIILRYFFGITIIIIVTSLLKLIFYLNDKAINKYVYGDVYLTEEGTKQLEIELTKSYINQFDDNIISLSDISLIRGSFISTIDKSEYYIYTYQKGCKYIRVSKKSRAFLLIENKFKLLVKEKNSLIYF